MLSCKTFFLVSFLLSSTLHYYNSVFCYFLQSWETITDDELTFNHSNSHSSQSSASEFHSVCDEIRDVQISGATAGELHASPPVSHLLERITCELSYNEIPRTWRNGKIKSSLNVSAISVVSDISWPLMQGFVQNSRHSSHRRSAHSSTREEHPVNPVVSV